MTNATNHHHHTWLSTIHFSTHTISLLLIITSLFWNAYNSYQNQILIEKQLEFENILAEILPSTSSSLPLNQQPSIIKSPIGQWFTKIFHSILLLRSNDATNNSHDNNVAKPYTVRITLVEMLIENLDTCICIYTYVWFLSRLFSFVSNMHNKLNETIKALKVPMPVKHQRLMTKDLFFNFLTRFDKHY